jgi:hypothetical protein
MYYMCQSARFFLKGAGGARVDGMSVIVARAQHFAHRQYVYVRACA